MTEPAPTSLPVVAPIRPTAPIERYRLLANGRVRDIRATDGERALAAAMHLWPLAIPLVLPVAPFIPLVLWLAFRSRSPFVDDHGREVLNAQITMLLLICVVCVGWVALVPWTVMWLIALVAGAVAAAGGEIFRYPMLLRAIR